MKILFVTHNEHKVREFNQILNGVATVEQLTDDYPEMRSDDPEEIVKEAVKKLAEKYNKPVVAEDSGIFIKALNGFPGTCSAYSYEKIGLTGLLKLMDGTTDRECEYKSAVGYCEPGTEPVSFLGTEKGKMAESIRGENGFGNDPIFIPEGSSETYAEMENVEESKRFRRIAVLKLMDYLKR